MKDKLSDLENKKVELYERASYFNAIAEARVPGVIPDPSHPQSSWLPLQYLLNAEGLVFLSQIYPPELVQQTGETLQTLMKEIHDSESGIPSREAAEKFLNTLKNRREVIDCG